jgi:hypothetical protein
MKYEISNAYDITFIQNDNFTFKTIKNRFGVTGNIYSSETVEMCFKDDRINVAIVGKDGEILSQKYIEKEKDNAIYTLNDIIDTLYSEEHIRI